VGRPLETHVEGEGQVTARGPEVDPRHRRPIRGQETARVTPVCDNMIDLRPHAADSPAHMDDLRQHQGEEGWALVTSFQRTHTPPRWGP
jgi:hypothetical protein